MHVVRMSELPVVIRVKTPRGVVVALPRTGRSEEVLTLARLVLSSEEFRELQGTLAPLPESGGKV